MTIGALIDKLDGFEIVGNQIAAILAIETVSQQALATAALKDPRLWAFRVYYDRANPWEEWLDAPESNENAVDATPIVCVNFDSANYDPIGSDVVKSQKSVGVFNIDCYGYGVTASDGASGHVPGDQLSAAVSQRVARIVRNILMSGEYAYLGLRGMVWKRWPQSLTAFAPSQDGKAMQQISAVRLALEVTFTETSPQVTGVTLDTLAASVKRASDGLVYLTATYGA